MEASILPGLYLLKQALLYRLKACFNFLQRIWPEAQVFSYSESAVLVFAMVRSESAMSFPRRINGMVIAAEAKIKNVISERDIRS
jgi:hypothetical protein